VVLGLNSSIRAGDPTEGCPDIGCECTCLPPSPSLRLARGAAAKRAPGSCLARLTEPDLLLHLTAIAISHFHPSFLYPLHLQSSGDGGLHSTCVSARCATEEVSHLERQRQVRLRHLLFTHLLLVEHRLRTAAPRAGPQPVLVERGCGSDEARRSVRILSIKCSYLTLTSRC
jgi:hypothetical protein